MYYIFDSEHMQQCKQRRMCSTI